MIEEGLAATVMDVPDGKRWRDTRILTLVDAAERHLLARRRLAGQHHLFRRLHWPQRKRE